MPKGQTATKPKPAASRAGARPGASRAAPKAGAPKAAPKPVAAKPASPKPVVSKAAAPKAPAAHKKNEEKGMASKSAAAIKAKVIFSIAIMHPT